MAVVFHNQYEDEKTEHDKWLLEERSGPCSEANLRS